MKKKVKMSTKSNNGAPSNGAVILNVECVLSGYKDAITLQNVISYMAEKVTMLALIPEPSLCFGSEDRAKFLAEESNPKPKVSKAKASSSKKRKKTTAKQKFKPSSKIKDKRGVWLTDSKGKEVIDHKATLANLGLSEGELLAMPTRFGTLENHLKNSVRATRVWSRKKTAKR